MRNRFALRVRMWDIYDSLLPLDTPVTRLGLVGAPVQRSLVGSACLA
jgi:hypothetical protein